MTISSIRRMCAFRASCMSKARYYANVNAFEQNKGKKEQTRRYGPRTVAAVAKKKEGFAALGGMRPVVYSYFALFNRARFRRGTVRAFIAVSTGTMRHGQRAPLRLARRVATRRVACSPCRSRRRL